MQFKSHIVSFFLFLLKNFFKQKILFTLTFIWQLWQIKKGICLRPFFLLEFIATTTTTMAKLINIICFKFCQLGWTWQKVQYIFLACFVLRCLLAAYRFSPFLSCTCIYCSWCPFVCGCVCVCKYVCVCKCVSARMSTFLDNFIFRHFGVL